jgi:mercuric ion binding protein
MLNKILFIIALLFSTTTLANEYSYYADVEGMVCAFCAYSVSKNISALPGVDAGSVDVDLKDGHVMFNSSQTVHEDKLTALFASSGFTISNLKQTELNTTASKQKNTSPVLTINVNRAKLEHYSGVLEAVGEIAARAPSHLLIRAPAAEEDKLLKSVLMGRQQVIKVLFVPEESEMIRIQLFSDSAN